jgi:hypothetical protein
LVISVGALIRRAETMKRWLELAAQCRCASLDVCDLFATDAPRASQTTIAVTR